MTCAQGAVTGCSKLFGSVCFGFPSLGTNFLPCQFLESYLLTLTFINLIYLILSQAGRDLSQVERGSLAVGGLQTLPFFVVKTFGPIPETVGSRFALGSQLLNP